MRTETALFHWRMHVLKAQRLVTQAGSYRRDILPAPSFTMITDEASHMEAMEALARAEYERDRDEVLTGCAVDADAKDGDAFGKLARYETSLERSLFRTLHELRQMQDRRNRSPYPIFNGASQLVDKSLESSAEPADPDKGAGPSST